MKIRDAFIDAQRRLPASPTPAADARLLLGHVLGVDAAFLVAHDDEDVPAAQAVELERLLRRASSGEPVPYLVGSAPFYDVRLDVTSDVLIPRPETEELVALALQWAADNRPAVAVDVGTGSGCIGITLARHLPDTHVVAIDISPVALRVARQNAARLLTTANMTFLRGSLLEPLHTQPLPELIVANLPYVTDVEWTALADGVKLHEPALALRGGPDGLTLIRELLIQISGWAANGANQRSRAIFLEIGWQQGSAAAALARELLPQSSVVLRQDFAGRDRFIVIT